MITSIVEINPNLRFANGETVVAVEDGWYGELPSAGMQVGVYERVSRIYGSATVVSIDAEDLVLAVDWDTLKRYDATEELDMNLTPEMADVLLHGSQMSINFLVVPHLTFGFGDPRQVTNPGILGNFVDTRAGVSASRERV